MPSNSEARAKIQYERLIEEDKGKTYMEILPEYFSKRKNFIVKDILKSINVFHEYINSCPLYNGRQFSKEEVVRYMMFTNDYFLCRLFIPHVTSTDLDFQFMEHHFETIKEDYKYYCKLQDEYREENKSLYDEAHKLAYKMAVIKEDWSVYLDRTAVQNKTYDISIEENGFPREGRGTMCYAFTPVKGDLSNLKPGDSFTCVNKRYKQKRLVLEVLEKNPDQYSKAYKCRLNGKEIFILPYDEIENAYDALFSVNKFIFSGWWNRTLIKID